MKKRIILGLGVFALFFFLGGIYIITSMEKATSTLDSLVKLHQIEILRENLLLRIKRVQTDLNLKNTRYGRGIDALVTDVRHMEEGARDCFGCHHSEEVIESLTDIRNQIEKYKSAISRVFTIRAGAGRVEEEEANAVRTGDELVAKVSGMIDFSSSRLEGKTESSLRDIRKMKNLLFSVVAISPFLIMVAGFLFIREIAKPVNTLLNATRILKGGDLNHRIEGLRDEFGEVASSFNEMADSLKDQMLKIEENEKRYRMLFESAADAIFILDAEGEDAGKILAANLAAAAMHGYNTVDEIIGLNIRDLDTPETAKEAAGRIRRIRRGERIKAEVTHRKKDGTVFAVEISAGLLEVGNRKYIMAIDRDITARKQAEEALRRAEQIKVCGDIATSLAHELKNLLAGLKIALKMLLENKNLTETESEIADASFSQIKRVEFLIKDVLNFARPKEPEFSMTNINGVLEKMTSFMMAVSSRSAGSGCVRVVKSFSSSVPEIMVDPMQIQQAVMNIMMNAYDAMPEGGTLQVMTALENGSVAIRISDSGPGIGEEEIENLFKPFYTTKIKGTGLGLPITKGIVERHGGSLSLTSEAGSGTTVTILLPVRR